MTSHPFAAHRSARPGSLTPATAVAVAILASLMIAVGVMPWRSELPYAVVPPAAVVDRTPAEELLLDAARTRERMECATCGRVETIQHTPQAGGTPASYRFGVRLGDGSLRYSTGAEAAGWRVGDRIMLLGGAGPAAPAASAPPAQ